MRIIKFRAYDKTNKEMMNDVSLVGDHIIFDYERGGYELDELELTYYDVLDGANEYEIMQYTGARDKHNKELYEGDICWFTPTLVENVPTFKGVLEWDNYRFTIRNLDYDARNFLTTPFVNLDLFCVSVEKIGNIYQNPDLL